MTYDPLAAYVRGPRLTELQRRTRPAHKWNVLMRHRANQSIVEVEVEAADTYEAGLRARDQCPGHTHLFVLLMHALISVVVYD